MRTIDSLDELQLPKKYIVFLTIFLRVAASVNSVERVILFGSCAREKIHPKSDVDLLVIGENISWEDESLIYDKCSFNGYPKNFIEFDMIVSHHEQYEKYKYTLGHMQRLIERDGIDLSAIMKENMALEVKL